MTTKQCINKHSLAPFAMKETAFEYKSWKKVGATRGLNPGPLATVKLQGEP
jgi:hypothetical protein